MDTFEKQSFSKVEHSSSFEHSLGCSKVEHSSSFESLGLTLFEALDKLLPLFVGRGRLSAYSIHNPTNEQINVLEKLGINFKKNADGKIIGSNYDSDDSDIDSDDGYCDITIDGIKDYLQVKYTKVIVTCTGCDTRDVDLLPYNYMSQKTVIIDRKKKGFNITLGDIIVVIESFITPPAQDCCGWFPHSFEYKVRQNTDEVLEFDLSYSYDT
jgi:hypothetical protein